jgi:general secretion pathway protein D
MKLIRVTLLTFLCLSFLGASEKININFKDLKIMDLIKITSKIIDKNILLTQNIKGKVDFISNKPVDKKELVKILIYVLESKGFTLVESSEILRIVKLNETVKSNAPIVNQNNEETFYQMVTEIFTVQNSNVDYIVSKVRHLLSKTGKLVTNKESNSLVITDFKDNIKTIKKVVYIMTKGAKKSTLTFELKNIKSSDAKRTLDAVAKSVFNEKVETQKVAVIENKNNNSLVLVGSLKNITYLKNYISKIDSNESLVKREVKVISLKNVEANNVIKIIDAIIGKKQYIDAEAKPLSSVDEETNSIIIMGPSDEIEYIEALVNELDKDKLQVYVEAKIIEVSETKTKNIGLKYGLAGGRSSSYGIGTLAASLSGSVFPLPDEASALVTLPENLTRGIALGATLNLLKENQAADIVSEPSILCINNKESSIYVGETRSISTSSTTGSTTSTSYTREDIGLTLKVKPRISNENKVTLEIETVLEDADGTTSSDGVPPDTTKKEVKTSAIVSNGEAVIIGGLIKNKIDTVNTKIPFFSDIPVLGNLFKNKERVKDKINLVVIVTPYIIPKSKDLTYIRRQLSQLKTLEDRYSKDLELRLEERKFELEKENLQREKRKEELEKDREKFYKNLEVKPKKSNEDDFNLDMSIE